jgi:hypothetical protein
MTYDVWSQTGPQTDGQILNLSRYVKGAGWFDHRPDHTVTTAAAPETKTASLDEVLCVQGI